MTARRAALFACCSPWRAPIAQAQPPMPTTIAPRSLSGGRFGADEPSLLPIADEQVVERARNLVRAGYADQGRQLLDDVQARHPDDLDVLLARAEFLMRMEPGAAGRALPRGAGAPPRGREVARRAAAARGLLAALPGRGAVGRGPQRRGGDEGEGGVGEESRAGLVGARAARGVERGEAGRGGEGPGEARRPPPDARRLPVEAARADASARARARRRSSACASSSSPGRRRARRPATSFQDDGGPAPVGSHLWQPRARARRARRGRRRCRRLGVRRAGAERRLRPGRAARRDVAPVRRARRRRASKTRLVRRRPARRGRAAAGRRGRAHRDHDERRAADRSRRSRRSTRRRARATASPRSSACGSSCRPRPRWCAPGSSSPSAGARSATRRRRAASPTRRRSSRRRRRAPPTIPSSRAASPCARARPRSRAGDLAAAEASFREAQGSGASEKVREEAQYLACEVGVLRGPLRFRRRGLRRVRPRLSDEPLHQRRARAHVPDRGRRGRARSPGCPSWRRRSASRARARSDEALAASRSRGAQSRRAGRRGRTRGS